jgi:penicillin-binding protein 2
MCGDADSQACWEPRHGMYLRSNERGPSMRGNQLALRMAVFGGVALVLFVILFFRLWFLQVLNGPKYLADANSNRTREFRVSAPRGKILDREGEPLAVNRTSLELQVNLQKLPPQAGRRKAELSRLAELTHTTLPRLLHTIGEESKIAFGAPVTLRRDIGYYLFYYLQENQDRFPGVTVQRVFVRRYPHGTLAAHVLGTVGEINEEELKEPRYKGLEAGDWVGKEGVEDTYDRFLRGKPGLTRIQVDAFGQPTPGGRLVSKRPVPGDNLKLTLDGKVQEAGEAALAAKGLPGGFITMDIHTGEILGLGSFPIFEPSLFTKPLTQKVVDETYNNPLGPMNDRAISGAYPTGSTFKVITALAALSSGVTTPERVIEDNGSIVIGGQTFEDAEGVGAGPVNLASALRVSSDVYFYTLGDEMWDTGALQHWARELGIGRNSGIDLPGAAPGLLPTKRWRDRLAAEGLAEERPWSVGDNVQLATGQGDLQTNPLQMAIAYAALGNGGTIVTPHVGKEIDDSAGRVLREFDPPARRHVHIDPAYRSEILEGLHEAAQASGGTSCSSFCGFPIQVAGKTGTAERGVGHANQSWYIVLAPYPNPRIVTAVTIEEGGYGAESAAPAAKEILEAYFGKAATAPAGASGGSTG